MNLVLVHLNSRLPSHLIANLAYLTRSFPAHQVYLVSDESVETDQIPLGIEVIKYESLNIDLPSGTDVWNYNSKFRSGFWITSKVRLLILSKLITSNRMSEMLHIESDVWLSPNFPFHYFASIQEDLAFPMADEKRGVASTLWVKGLAGAQLLSKFAERYWSETDMGILGKLAHEGVVKILPSAFPSDSSDQSGFWFDGAVIGMHLLGEDPRNRFGLIRRFHKVHGLQPDLRGAHFYFDKTLLTIYRGNTIEIVSIHNHLKSARIFILKPVRFWIRQLRKRERRLNYSFSARALMFAVKEVNLSALRWCVKRLLNKS